MTICHLQLCLSFAKLFIILLNLIFFLWSWCNYKIAHLSIVINFLAFDSIISPCVHLHAKLIWTWLLFMVRLYIYWHSLLWTTLKIYLGFIHGTLKIFSLYLGYIKHIFAHIMDILKKNLNILILHSLFKIIPCLVRYD